VPCSGVVQRSLVTKQRTKKVKDASFEKKNRMDLFIFFRVTTSKIFFGLDIRWRWRPTGRRVDGDDYEMLR